jgi:hypothetical protein
MRLVNNINMIGHIIKMILASYLYYILGADRGTDFIRPMLRYLSVDKPAAVPLLTTRVISNMFNHEAGAQLGLRHHGEILIRARESLPILPKANQKQAYATLLLNYAVATRKQRYLNILQKKVMHKCSLFIVFSKGWGDLKKTYLRSLFF